MAQTIAQRRKCDRDRKRRQRAAARAAGAPTGAAVNAAIAEATAFALAGVNIGTATGPAILVETIVVTARSILIERGGYDPRRSAMALKKALAPRGEHTWPSYVPTHADAHGDGQRAA